MKRILVIGNGFDLAHKLPTRYSDFLEFIQMWKKFGEKRSPEHFGKNIGNVLLQPRTNRILENYKAFESVIKTDEFWALKEDYGVLESQNSFMQFFLFQHRSEQWIDLENAIEQIICFINDLADAQLKDGSLNLNLTMHSGYLPSSLGKYLTKQARSDACYMLCTPYDVYEMDKVWNDLKDELNMVRWALEKYLIFVGRGKMPEKDDVIQSIINDEKYSLQGTTQGRYLTGGVPPVRFSM